MGTPHQWLVGRKKDWLYLCKKKNDLAVKLLNFPPKQEGGMGGQ